MASSQEIMGNIKNSYKVVNKSKGITPKSLDFERRRPSAR